MAYGIFCGLTAALLMSTSYIFSKRFMLIHSSAFQLTVNAQIFQGLLGAVLLLLIHDKYGMEGGVLHWRNLVFVLGASLIGMLANFAFFQTLKLLEASRLSSLLGLKIAMLGMICMIFFGHSISWLQWTAILLATVAAVGMNFTGGHITAKAGFWLFLTLLGYSMSDLAGAHVFTMIDGENRLFTSFACTSLLALLPGITMVPMMVFRVVPFRWKTMLDSAPYGLCWFISLLFLFDCFNSMGVIFGTILQSARGVISVLLGVLLLRWGFSQYEPRVGRSAWIRRFIMAVLMVCAMTLYAISKQQQ